MSFPQMKRSQSYQLARSPNREGCVESLRFFLPRVHMLEMLGIEPRASYMQSMRSTTELHPHILPGLPMVHNMSQHVLSSISVKGHGLILDLDSLPMAQIQVTNLAFTVIVWVQQYTGSQSHTLRLSPGHCVPPSNVVFGSPILKRASSKFGFLSL